MFLSHFIKSNHRVLGKNKVGTYGPQVLYLIIPPLFKLPKCDQTPLSILSILDLYG
jgi:hypothetical protein